jgi:hypothetical protein
VARHCLDLGCGVGRVILVTVKTAVSIPDRIFAAAERYARRRGIPRSQVYAEALSRLMAEEESDDDLTTALDQTCAQVDSDLDEFGKTAARRRLAATEW